MMNHGTARGESRSEHQAECPTRTEARPEPQAAEPPRRPPASAPDAIAIGVDAGGTGCRARVFDAEGGTLGAADGGPANLLLGDGENARRAIMDAVFAAIARAGLDEHDFSAAHLGVGAAGLTKATRAAFFAAGGQFARAHLLTDSHAAALGAHKGADGAVAILGTGAAACVVANGQAREIGGWGLCVDDLGSGADIGRAALRAALRSLDAPGPETPFARAVLRMLGRAGMDAAVWATGAKPGQFGVLAPLVFDRAEDGDGEAGAILTAASGELARLISLCAAHGAPRISIAGSVAERLEERLPPAVRARLTPAEADACFGAALAARRGLGWTA